MLIRFLASLRSDRRAVAMLEYGLIAALVSVVVISGVTTLGQNLSVKFSTIANQVSSP